jgi:hypothetical protein
MLSWNSTCFGQFVCPSSGVYSLYTQLWYMSYRFVDSFRVGSSWSRSIAVYKPVWHIPLLSVQWINSWWWTYELSETCRVSWQHKIVKLVHLVSFITKKFVTMHGHVNVNSTLHSTAAGSNVSRIIGYPEFAHTLSHWLQANLFQTNPFRPRPLPSKPSLIHQSSFDPIWRELPRALWNESTKIKFRM